MSNEVSILHVNHTNIHDKEVHADFPGGQLNRFYYHTP